MDYGKFGIARVYNKARVLPPVTLNLWKREILKFVPRKNVKLVVDLGCGSGRFIKYLKDAFHTQVIGIDPSPEMLAAARGFKISGVKFLRGKAEKIPLPNYSADLIFMSMTFHFLKDKPKALKEMKRVLRPGGYAVIRQATTESNAKESLLQKFFPESMRIADKINPLRKNDILGLFKKLGWRILGVKSVKQKVANNLHGYYERLRQRAASIFQLIPDQVWRKRLAVFREYCFRSRARGPVYEYRYLFVFQK